MKPVIIWGTGGIAEELLLLIKEDNSRQIVAFCASREFCTENTFLGLPLIADDDLDRVYPPSECDIILTVGFKSMSEFRQYKFKDLKSRGYHIQNYIHKSAIVQESSVLGEGNIIMQGVVIGTKCRIGNSNIMLMGCNISHDIVIGNFCYFAPGVTLGGFVKSEDRCFFGLNSTIYPYVRLSWATLVGAGAIIANDTMPYEVYSQPRSIKLKKRSTEFFYA